MIDVISAIITKLIIMLLYALIVYLAWDHVMPVLFGLPTIDFQTSFLLIILSNVLLKTDISVTTTQKDK